MLIDTSVTIAYKCSSCGTFEFFYISLFSLLYKKECLLTCRCNKSSISITRENFKDFRVKIPCIGCGSEHTFVLCRKDFLYKDISIFYCPVTGMQNCFIGSDDKVSRKIDNLEKEFDELIDKFGYDNYFKNTQVMFDSLNIIHDIAEKGNLECQCGNNDIELILLSDKIHLECRKCGGKRIVNAASNKDLKDIFNKRHILLTQGYLQYNIIKSKFHMGNNDG